MQLDVVLYISFTVDVQVVHAFIQQIVRYQLDKANLLDSLHLVTHN
ncbi:hypothetical protein [Komarekiella delphini-convector]|nr:hypothetical protein [Komarekiella delphini-convector]